MVTAFELVSKGYFPRELPPPFTTKPFGNLTKQWRGQTPPGFALDFRRPIITRHAIHNLTRFGLVRRQLSIPNPVNFYHIASLLEMNWSGLLPNWNSSKISLSKPSVDPAAARAVIPSHPWSSHPLHRAALRATSKYILKSDIDGFYPSVYTHSIPWAIHTKPAAKANRKPNALLGNQIDRCLQYAQDQQTKGIPISPDTSLVIAEILLGRADVELAKLIQVIGFRSYDDHELGFRSHADAENGLAALQGVLAEYELQINTSKTKIIELPAYLDPPWGTELGALSIGTRSQYRDLLRYVDRAFELFRQHPGADVLKYSISRLNSIVIASSEWGFFQDFLFQCSMVEPATLHLVIDHLHRYEAAGYPIDKVKLETVLNTLMSSRGPLGCGNEVAWALWGAILFNIPVDQMSAKVLEKMIDPVVALLALDAKNKNLISNQVTFSQWLANMSQAELERNQWLFAYEVNVKGWLPLPGGTDYVLADPRFALLKQNGVHFYDDSLVSAHGPTNPISVRIPRNQPQNIDDSLVPSWDSNYY
jgi:hypothetical protein